MAGGVPVRDAETSRAAFVRAYDAARAGDDVDAMVEAALGLAGTQEWGTIPGRLPAFLHEAYTRSHGAQRARMAVAIARAWAYGGDPRRAEAFAAEAVADAEQRGDATALAAALDALLLVHWGPDDLDARVRITERLDDTVAHVTDVEAQMSARLWRLTTALECLDRTTALRQLRALDVLAEESASDRVRFFAASRRAMFALLNDDVAAARVAAAEATAAGWAAGEPDAFAIEHALAGDIARTSGDCVAMAREAPVFEEAAEREGLASVGAEAALLWAEAGELDRAARLLRRIASGLGGLARDVEWTLTVVSLTAVAVAVVDGAVLADLVAVLEPYAGRAVINGGAVGFAGVVDDYLARAYAVLDRPADAQRAREVAADAYRRIDAPGWLRRLAELAPTAPTAGAHVQPSAMVVVHLRPGEGGLWWVGAEGATTALRDARGLHYLRFVLARPGADVAAVEMSDAVAGHRGTAGLGGLEVLDATALAAYRRRLTEIDTELDEARDWADPGRVAHLETEREALLAELRAATGLGGRTRRVGGTDERARVAVRKAIASAIDRIAVVDPVIGRLLTDTVRTGAQCRYDPDPNRPVRWVLDATQSHARAAQP